MKIFVTSAYQSHDCLDRVHQLYLLDTYGHHELVTSVNTADAIVFVENTQFDDMRFQRLMNHPLVKRFPEKIFMYNEMDRAWPLLPGLYCSMEQDLGSQDRYVSFPYLTAANNGIKDIFAAGVERKWLYSFVGSLSHPIRKNLKSLQSDNAQIVDTSEFCTWDPTQTSKYRYQKLYTDTMAESKFVLCPRGIGPASLRLYETLEAGRVPVIISNNWSLPPQINWEFAVQVSPADIAKIPQLLERLEPEWQERSLAARNAWQSAYAPHKMFNTLGDTIQGIRQTRPAPEHSWRASALKWRVSMEQGLRSWFKPSPVTAKPRTGVMSAMQRTDRTGKVPN